MDDSKPYFPAPPILKFFYENFKVGPWVSRIDWSKGHWCSSTYMVVRLSDISPKTGQKCIFGVFRPFLNFCRTVSRTYRLSHINALQVNQFYLPKDQSMKFWSKSIENWRSWKMTFCFVFGYWVFQKKNFLCLSMKRLWGIIHFCTMDGFFRILEKTSFQLICTRLYGQLLNIISSYGWYEKSLRLSHNY